MAVSWETGRGAGRMGRKGRRGEEGEEGGRGKGGEGEVSKGLRPTRVGTES